MPPSKGQLKIRKNKPERQLGCRTTDEDAFLIERGCEVTKRTRNQFIVWAATEAAKTVLAQHAASNKILAQVTSELNNKKTAAA